MWVLGGARVARVKRCRDGNECEVYIIPFLFGSFFAVGSPTLIYNFFGGLFLPFYFGGRGDFLS